MKYLVLLIVLLTACISNYTIPSKKYDDEMISTSKNLDGTTTHKFYRHGLEYNDVANGQKLLSRKVYDNRLVIYRYPVLEENVNSSKLFLKSGNDFLSRTGTDTLVFINEDLPIMNRRFWGKGILFSRITNNSYLLQPAQNNDNLAKIYVSASHNYEEIQNSKDFIADSLILPIR